MGAPMVSPKGHELSQSSSAVGLPTRTSSTPSTPLSPRLNKSGQHAAKLKSPSPRSSQGLKSTFGRKKSPRVADEARSATSSPPLSARELTADASTLAALDEFLDDAE